jgi:hypothetical protein
MPSDDAVSSSSQPAGDRDRIAGSGRPACAGCHANDSGTLIAQARRMTCAANDHRRRDANDPGKAVSAVHQLLHHAGIFISSERAGICDEHSGNQHAGECQAGRGARRACARNQGQGDVCLTCSFQAEDVLLTKLAIALDPVPILFLDTGYHFQETYAYRDRIAREWG